MNIYLDYFLGGNARHFILNNSKKAASIGRIPVSHFSHDLTDLYIKAAASARVNPC